MTINILPLQYILVTVTKCLEVSTGCFMADITFNTISLFDIHLVEEIHQFLGGDFISERQKVNTDFIHDVFVNQEGLVPISIRVDRNDFPISKGSTIQLTESTSTVCSSTHPDGCLVCRGAPLVVGK